MPTPDAERRPAPDAAGRPELLAELYGPDRAALVEAQLAALISGAGAPDPVAALPGVWLIAYPDHVHAEGRSPLAALRTLCTEVLAPWIGGVHTLPIHPFSSDRGFSVIDPAVVEPRFGTWADLERLASDVAWMADAVVNHVSAHSPWFQAYLAGDPAFAGFFAELPEGTAHDAVIRPRTSPLAHRFTRPDGSTLEVWTTFSADQVDLDFAEPRVLVAVAEMLARYLAHGAVAIRLDAIAFVWKDPATASMSLPQTHRIVQVLRAVVDAIRPGTMLLTETNVAHAENVSYFGPGRGVRGGMPEASAVYQFALPPLVLHALLAGDAAPLTGWARALEPPPEGCTFANMLATHDGIGVRGAEGWLSEEQLAGLVAATERAGGVVNRRQTASGDRPYELAVAWWATMGEGVLAEQALARHLAAHTILVAVRGVALLYLNSLFAIGNDSETFARSGLGRDLNRAGVELDRLRARLADPGSLEARCWAGMRELLDRRAASAAADPDAEQVVHDLGPALFAVERRSRTLGRATVVVVNVTAAVQRWALHGWGEGVLEPWSSVWLGSPLRLDDV